MMDYERECLSWQQRQLALRQKYADTPPGLSGSQAQRAQAEWTAAWADHEKRRERRLAGGAALLEEPFAGRQAELAAIRQLFLAGRRMVFLSGMGGIGKSALARAYGRVYGKTYDQVLLWRCDQGLERLFADDGQLAISNLRYAQGRYRSYRRYAKEKYETFRQIAAQTRILILLDNLGKMNDPWMEAVRALPCDVLVTTRLSGEALAGEAVLPVEGLQSEADWADFYRAYTGMEPAGPQWERMCQYRETVLGHTLMMKLALLNPQRQWSEERVARSMLGRFRLKKSERQVLCELSFLSLSGIPEGVFLRCTQESAAALEALKRDSLVQVGMDGLGRPCLSLHPVIAQAVRVMWRPGLSRCYAFFEEFGRYARSSWYRPREEDLWLAPQVLAILEKLPEPVAWRYYPYECLASCLTQWEYYDEAERLERKLFDCVAAYYGENHQTTGRLAARMAAMLHNQMRYEESFPWRELAYRIYKQAQPQDHYFYVHRSEACEKLAQAYEHRGDFQRAHTLLDEAFEAVAEFDRDARLADPGIWQRNRPRWALNWHRRAVLYFKQGDLDAAQAALDRGLHLFPMDEYLLLESRRQVQAAIYLARGEYERARAAAQRDLAICIRYQGESVIVSLNYREQLADALMALGRVQEAQRAYIRVLDCLSEKYPHRADRIRRVREKLGKTNC